MTATWKEYQEEAAAFFRGLGLDAQTDVTAQGVRTTHDIDVFVTSHHVGFKVIWIVECKLWTSKVSKLHVLALREIVADLGADRGILLSEAGFQSGAIEAATLTNVHVTSLSELRQTASTEILAMRLRELHDRVEACRKLYWEIPKEARIEYGLRPEVGTSGYSGTGVIKLASELLSKAFRGTYPIDSKSLDAFEAFELNRQFKTAQDIIAFVEPMITDLQTKLRAWETNAGGVHGPCT